MDTFSLNPNPLPGKSMAAQELHRLVNMVMILAAVLLIIGALYWWSTIGGNTSQVSNGSSSNNTMQLRVADALRAYPVHASQEQIDSVASQLVSSDTTNATEAQKQAVAGRLQ